MNRDFALKLVPFVRALRLYHRHKVVGLEKVPDEGSLIIATNHSLATYDIALLMAAIFDRNGRLPRSLIDHAFYRVPYLGELMEKAGCVAGTQENAIKLLHSGELLYLAPGGMKESLRPSSERYKILWSNRRGFAKLSFQTGAPIILGACPKADEIYEVYDNPVTGWIYENLRLPFFVARGFGVSPLPRPIKLYHLLSEPIYPPKPSDDEDERKKQLASYHKSLTQRMEKLMKEALKLSKD